MMIRRIIFFALVLAFGYTFATDVPSCNPFAKYQDTKLYSTCKDSKLEYGAFGSPLKVVASLGDCGMKNGTSAITAFFADKRLKLQPAESYYLEYSINTTSKDGSCVIAIQTSDGEERIKDQNGIENSADADTTEFSLNKWYERKFIIKSSQLPSDGSLRLSLSCASAEASRVEVHIDNIRLGRVGINKPDYVLFDSKTMCPACKGSAPVPTANCEPNGQNSDPIWTVEGHVRQQNITLPGVTIFKGDVYTDKLDVSEVTTTRLSGCLYPLEQKSIELVVSPTALFLMVFHGENCPTPKFSIVPKYERDERCEYKIRPMTIRVVEGSVFYSIHYVFDAKCQSPDQTTSKNADQNGMNQVLALIILIVTIGVGATLGVSIYVVRRHKQKKIVAKFQPIRVDSQENITL